MSSRDAYQRRRPHRRDSHAKETSSTSRLLCFSVLRFHARGQGGGRFAVGDACRGDRGAAERFTPPRPGPPGRGLYHSRPLAAAGMPRIGVDCLHRARHRVAGSASPRHARPVALCAATRCHATPRRLRHPSKASPVTAPSRCTDRVAATFCPASFRHCCLPPCSVPPLISATGVTVSSVVSSRGTHHPVAGRTWKRVTGNIFLSLLIMRLSLLIVILSNK